MSITKEERQIMLAREARRGKSTYQVLQLYYMKGPKAIELTDTHEEVRRRISTVHAMLLDAQSSMQIVQQIKVTFDVSESTAWSDLRMARKLFGDINEADKRGQKAILYELALDDYRRAKLAGDLKAQNAAMGNLIKLGGHDRDDPDKIDFDKITPGIYPIMIAKEQEHILKKLVESPVVDLSQIMNQMAEDAQVESDTDSTDQEGDQEDSQEE